MSRIKGEVVVTKKGKGKNIVAGFGQPLVVGNIWANLGSY